MAHTVSRFAPKRNPDAALIARYLEGRTAAPIHKGRQVIGVRYIAPTGAASAPCGLYAAPGTNSNFCGPTALAAVTGKSVTECEDAVLAYRAKVPAPRSERKGAARVKSMWSYEIEDVAARLGAKALGVHYGVGPHAMTLAQFVRHARLRYPDASLIVLVTGHFIALRGDHYVDTGARVPTPIAKYRRKRSRVLRAWAVTKQAS